MNNNNFLKQIGKLTISFVLTGILVTAIVYGASTVRTNFANGEVLDATDLNSIQPAIDEKLSIASIPTCGTDEYLTTDASGFVCKKLTDNTLSQSDVLNTISSSCKICIAWSDVNLPLSETYKSSAQKGKCMSVNSASFSSIKTTGKVNGDDTFGVKVVCSGGTWSTISTNSTTACYPSHNTTEKSGMCFAGDTNTYYGGTKTACTFYIPYAGGGTIPGFTYSKRFTQTCN